MALSCSQLANLLLLAALASSQIRTCASVGSATGLLVNADDEREDRPVEMSQSRTGLEIVHRKTLRDGTYFELPRHTIRNWHIKGMFRPHPDKDCSRIAKFHVTGTFHHATLILTVAKSGGMHRFYVSCPGLGHVAIPRRHNYPIRYQLPANNDIYAQTIPMTCLHDNGILPYFEVVLHSEECSADFLNTIHTWILLSGPVERTIG